VETGCRYVIRSPSGLRKIGMSTNLKLRLVKLRAVNALDERGEFTIEAHRDCWSDLLRNAERSAHAAVSQHRVVTEWFRIDLSSAINAIETGIAEAERDDPRTGRDKPESSSLEYVQFKMEPSLRKRIKAWRFENRVESEGEAIRQLLMDALRHHEKGAA
jgi:hypothetical protein